jgi:DNA-binding CsgD family transcriptional regulator
MNAEHPLQTVGRELRARSPQDVVRLHDALAGARRGLRKMLTLDEAARRLSLAVIPLCLPGQQGMPATLLLMGKRRVCEGLSVQCYAREHGLTSAETRVLEGLCSGLGPRELTEKHGVGMSTVRTQIGSIRTKTGAESIRDLVRRVASLPPMVSILRAAA